MPGSLDDLVNGYEMDLQFPMSALQEPGDARFPIASEEDLISYCKCVASTVGEMMVHCIWAGCGRNQSVDEQVVLQHASDAGIALQLVNIARDIMEDARNGRIYIPLQWDPSRTFHIELLLNPRVPSQKLQHEIKSYALRLVALAEYYYLRSLPGLRSLPKSARKGTALALAMYMEIGREIQRRGGDVVSERVHPTRVRKVWILVTLTLFDFGGI